MFRILIILVFSLSVNLYSSTGYTVELKCPLCDHDVSYWAQASYTIFYHELDLKPGGAAVIPTPIPRCKNCNFAFMEDFFTKEEIQALKNFIINQKAFAGKDSLPNYYYLAYELELLNSKKYNHIVYFYVNSVWEYSNKKDKDKNIYAFLMRNAIDKINALAKKDSEDYDNLQLIKLDFLRRLGSFEEAKTLIDTIKSNKNLYKEIVVDIISRQIKLIEEKDTQEHIIGKDDD
ncbi:MAG: hypothetical protein FWC26_03255 [Fibromonadales bacterium]|nr:hypothetical protein [Fibromonadales bacterium]